MYFAKCVCCCSASQPMEVYVDDEAKLTLHGLQQHYVKLKENEKNKKLFELLDILEFNQVLFAIQCDDLHYKPLQKRTVVFTRQLIVVF